MTPFVRPQRVMVATKRTNTDSPSGTNVTIERTREQLMLLFGSERKGNMSW